MTVHLTPPSDVPSRLGGLGVLKRLFDIIASATALILLAPVLLIVALLVRIKLGAPVLFTQERIGLNGQPFLIYKFRSMLPPGPGREDDASRLTAFGRKLRATSLDELPELWNVLNGTMSLVGPRPLLVEYLPLYSARQARRHDVRPGLTGHAQVNGRNSVEWDVRLEMDVWYVENRSLWLDIKIILKTIQVAFGGQGVSAEGNATMPRFTGSRPQDKAEASAP
jgi:lipopolysaccharide/colanic/teichoic acid biosynthesis glycosyltransferase